MIRKIHFLNREILLNAESDADNSVIEEVFIDRDYSVVEDKIKKAKIIIDIGAHIGCFSIYASILNNHAKIIAFEPEERNFKLLKENLKLNTCTKVEAKNLAVSNEIGTKVINISSDSHNHSFLNIESKVGEKKVNSTTLEKVLSSLDQCDLVKMDCEGAEYEILLNLQGKDFKKINAFYIEFHEFSEGKNKNDLKNALQKNGFRTDLFESRYSKNLGFILAERKN